MQLSSIVVLSLSLMGSGVALAFERDHGAHEHGHANLTFVVEGNEILVSLTSPAMNIVGFEHAPVSAEEKNALTEAVKVLNQPLEILTLDNDAGCTLEHARVESTLIADTAMSPDHHDGDHHGKAHRDEDHHDEDHGKGHHDEDHHDEEHHGEEHHEEGHHDDDHHAESHSDIEAEYHFQCQDAQRLSTVRVGLFEAFPGMEEIEVQIAGDRGQKLLELDSQNTEVRF